MRIARITERITPLPGGKEVHVAELTRCQVADGHDVRVLFHSGDPRTLASATERIGLPRALASLQGLSRTSAFAVAAAARLPRDVDIVHVHGDLSEAWAGSVAGHRRGAAVVLTVHGGLNPRYAGVSRWAFQGVDEIVALGDGVRQDLLRCGVPDDRITVMSSGLNGELLDTASHGVTREPGLVVTVGSLDPVKDVSTTIRAVLATAPQTGLHLDVIGTGHLFDELVALAGGDPRVRFLGQLDRAGVYARVAAADAFVLASRRLQGKGEGVPTAVLEAMWLGTPCLLSAQATPAGVVAADCYRTFPAGDSAALTALLTAPSGTSTVFRARSAVVGLRWPVLAQRVESVYERALLRRSR